VALHQDVHSQLKGQGHEAGLRAVGVIRFAGRVVQNASVLLDMLVCCWKNMISIRVLNGIGA
jgi:hypothetical protein